MYICVYVCLYIYTDRFFMYKYLSPRLLNEGSSVIYLKYSSKSYWQLFIGLYVSMYVPVYIYIYVYMCICVYIHIYRDRYIRSRSRNSATGMRFTPSTNPIAPGNAWERPASGEFVHQGQFQVGRYQVRTLIGG